MRFRRKGRNAFSPKKQARRLRGEETGALACSEDDEYEEKSGTSMATPHVAGAAALLLAENPDLSVNKLKGVLKNQARTRDSLEDKTVSEGRLNLKNAMNAVS